MVWMMRAVNEEDWGPPEWPGYWRCTKGPAIGTIPRL